jgi:hypothetical protein
MAKRKENKGGNSKLKGKSWRVPDYALNAISNAVKTYETLQKEDVESEETTQGYKRAKSILEVKNLKYNHIKTIKSWFDNFDGDHDDMEYRLHGGKTMHNWVDSTLNRERAAVKNPKKIKSDTGLTNQFIKNHEKDNNQVKHKSTFSIPNMAKDISGQIKRGKPIYEPMGMTEELERMKNLIIYESKI